MPAIEGDGRGLRRALCKLVSNAIKFTPAGGSIKVTAQLDGEMTRLAVSDTGVGIPPEEQARVFEAFTRVRPYSGSGRSRHSRPGLGLSLVKHIFELHGGRAWIETPPRPRPTPIFTRPPPPPPPTAGPEQ